MRKSCVYYNEKNGYYIVPEMRAKDVPVWVSAGPVERVEDNCDMSEVGKAIDRALNTSESYEAPTLAVARNNHFWVDYGYKSYGAFSKKHVAIQVEDDGKKICLTKLIRDKQGAYEKSKSEEDMLELDSCADTNDISNAINRILCDREIINDTEKKSFMTLGGVNVSFLSPDSNLEDCGDGNTDAYQVYKDLNSNDYIAFLIDNGYQSYDEVAIREVLERQFGKFDTFSFDDSVKDVKKIKATNQSGIIESVLYIRNENSFEVICYVEHADSKALLEYNKILNSMQIEKN